MLTYPRTLAEARAYRYGRWAGNERGNPYDEHRCAMEVPAGTGFYLYRQCLVTNGHGPDKLYCRKHAAKVARRDKTWKLYES